MLNSASAQNNLLSRCQMLIEQTACVVRDASAPGRATEVRVGSARNALTFQRDMPGPRTNPLRGRVLQASPSVLGRARLSQHSVERAPHGRGIARLRV